MRSVSSWYVRLVVPAIGFEMKIVQERKLENGVMCDVMGLNEPKIAREIT